MDATQFEKGKLGAEEMAQHWLLFQRAPFRQLTTICASGKEQQMGMGASVHTAVFFISLFLWPEVCVGVTQPQTIAGFPG